MSSLGFILKRIEQSDLSAKRKREALDNALLSYPDETDILHGVFEIPDTRRFTAEILKGAHVRIFDFGARYAQWKQLTRARTRRSSHQSDGPQYHVDGPLVHTVLFGRIGSYTWMQLEGHPQGVGHVIDWIKYSVTSKNQGPYGSSAHVENRPLVFHPPAPRHRVTQQQAVFR